jgi:lysophospholipase L1-like esterase
MKRLRRLVLAALGLASSSAFAVRTAVFPATIRERAAIWLDQDRILKAEDPQAKTRPIWVHGGDSIATAWANGPTLRTRLAKAERMPLPVPGSIDDIMTNLPDPARTWYAGTAIEGGLLGALDRLWGSSWVVISSALGGAQATPRGDEDPLSYMTTVREPERVRLVTFSLGSNDVCEGNNPVTQDPQFGAKLGTIRATYPHALIVPFRVIRVRQLWMALNARLDTLPPSTGLDRVRAYCRAQWTRVCPQAMIDNETFTALASEQIENVYVEKFQDLFDAEAALKDTDWLDLFSGDCFHPSAPSDQRIKDALVDFVRDRLPRP